MHLANSIALYADKPTIEMLPFIDEINDNAKTVCHVSEDDGEEESSCSDLNPDIPTNNDDPTAGNEIHSHWTPHQRKRVHIRGDTT